MIPWLCRHNFHRWEWTHEIRVLPSCGLPVRHKFRRCKRCGVSDEAIGFDRG